MQGDEVFDIFDTHSLVLSTGLLYKFFDFGVISVFCFRSLHVCGHPGEYILHYCCTDKVT